MSTRSRRWIRNTLLAASCAAALILLGSVAVLFFFGDRIYPRLLVQPARYVDRLQYVWHSLDTEPFSVYTSDGLKLACFHAPAIAQPARGTCLILHGHSYGKDGMAGLAKKLTAMGYDVVAFDARAHGESEGSVSTVGSAEGTDAIAVMQQARENFHLPHPYIVLGQSLGAATAIRMITLPDNPMDAAIIISPYARLRDVATRETRKYLWFTDTARVMEGAEKLAGRDLWSFSPIRLAPDIAIPVLEIHGTADKRFPISEAREVFDAIGTALPRPAGKQMLEAIGAGHNDILAGGMPWSDQVSKAMADFLASVPAP